MTALPRVTAIIAAYNEIDIIHPCLLDLIEQGICVYLLDHGSTDGTVDAVADLVSRGVVRLERYPEENAIDGATHDEFSLRRIIERKEQIVHTLGPGWYINHDADEFRESPWTGVGLREGIGRVDALGYNAIDFEVLDFVPTHDRFQPGDDPRAAFPFHRPSPDVNRLQIRCFRYTDGPLDLRSSAGHEAVFPDRRVFPVRFLLRHYPYRGQAHGERKLFRERRPRYAKDERAQQWHVQYDALETGHCFIVDEERLDRFHDERVRTGLWLRHRGVEEAETARDAAASACETARAEVAALSERLVVAARERDSVQAELSIARADAEARSAELVSSRADAEARSAELVSTRAEAADLRRSLSEARANIDALGERLDEALRLLQDAEERAEQNRGLYEQALQAADDRNRAVVDLEHCLEDIYASWSWRSTAVARAAVKRLRGY